MHSGEVGVATEPVLRCVTPCPLFQVILILTKYYHAESTKVLESSLWR